MAAVLVLVAVVAAGVASVAWMAPTERTTTAEATFTHHGELSYVAPAPGSAVYDDDTVDTGEPVFLQVVDTVTATFSYRADGLAEPPSGQISLAAELRGASGWRREVPLVPTEAFADGETEIEVDLELRQLLAVAARIDTEIGVSTGSLTLSLLPVVTLDGEDGALPAAPFDPQVEFQLDAQVLRPASGPDEPGDPIVVTEDATVPTSERVENHLGVLGRQVPVEPTRQVAAGLAVAAALAALVVAVLARRSRASDAQRIAARYPGRIVTAEHVEPTSLPTVDLTTIDDLARVAEREDRFVLHVAGTNEYLVHADTAVYRYCPSGTAPIPDADRPAAQEGEPQVPCPAQSPAPASPPFEDVASFLEQPRSVPPPYRVDSVGNVEPGSADDAGATDGGE